MNNNENLQEISDKCKKIIDTNIDTVIKNICDRIKEPSNFLKLHEFEKNLKTLNELNSRCCSDLGTQLLSMIDEKPLIEIKKKN